jgi:hypothetical protein
MAGRGALSLAAKSGRGGTTGRAIGWPASVRAEPGADPPPGVTPGAGGGADGVAERFVSKGRVGRGITPGRAGELIAPGAPGRRPSAGAAGKGCLGPESIWPGRGVDAEGEVGSGLAAGGTGRPGANAVPGGVGGAALGVLAPGAPGAPKGGCTGRPVPSGGRMGAAVRDSSAACRSLGSTAARACGMFTTGRAAGGALTAVGAVWTGASSSTVSVAVPPDCCKSGTSWPYSRRSLIATSSSMELEWVFFSVTPNSGSRSKIS